MHRPTPPASRLLFSPAHPLAVASSHPCERSFLRQNQTGSRNPRVHVHVRVGNKNRQSLAGSFETFYLSRPNLSGSDSPMNPPCSIFLIFPLGRARFPRLFSTPGRSTGAKPTSAIYSTSFVYRLSIRPYGFPTIFA